MRPLFSRSTESIRAIAIAAHREGDCASLSDAVSELLNFRTTPEARRLAAELSPLLDQPSHACEPASECDDTEPSRAWLAGIRDNARRFAAGPSSGSHTVYLVLLHDPDDAKGFGVYVGATGHTAEERFAKHKRGHRASRHVKKYGVRLLRPFFDHLEGISREEALSIEAELADALEDAGYWVEGGH